MLAVFLNLAVIERHHLPQAFLKQRLDIRLFFGFSLYSRCCRLRGRRCRSGRRCRKRRSRRKGRSGRPLHFRLPKDNPLLADYGCRRCGSLFRSPCRKAPQQHGQCREQAIKMCLFHEKSPRVKVVKQPCRRLLAEAFGKTADGAAKYRCAARPWRRTGPQRSSGRDYEHGPAARQPLRNAA